MKSDKRNVFSPFQKIFLALLTGTFFLALFFAVLLMRVKVFGNTKPSFLVSAPMSSSLIRRQTERAQLTKPGELIKTLGIHEGMEILDFGAGTGQYTYIFADAMKGTGMVYATDISPEKIRYITQEIERKGIKNITPILTSSTGFDRFYEDLRVDLIFMAHTHYFLSDKILYFSNLKNSLLPGGRLAILSYKMPANFKSEDITDMSGLSAFLKTAGLKYPPFSFFDSAAIEELLRDENTEATEKLKTVIVDNLNRLLSSDLLIKVFFDKDGVLKPGPDLLPEEKVFMEWLMRFLTVETPSMDQATIPGVAISSADVHRDFCKMYINRILIVSYLRPFLFNGRAPYLPGNSSQGDSGFMQNEKKMMKGLGYELVGEYDFIPFEELLIFSPKRAE